MKKFKVICVLLFMEIMLLLIFTGNILAATSGFCGRDITWKYDFDSRTLIIEGEGEMYNYENTMMPWYSQKDSIKKITISEGITNIGNEAFQNLKTVETVILPNSIETIGHYAFDGCERLKSIKLGNRCKTIGDYAFLDCNSLSSVDFGENLEEIGIGSFKWCALLSVNMPKSVVSIGKYAFQYCKSLQKVKIPECLEELDDNVFDSCERLIEIIWGKSLKKIGNKTFRKCINLKEIAIPNSVEYIEDGSFQYCESLINVILGDSVKAIGENGFKKCNRDLTIIIPPNVTTIKENSFENVYDVTFKGEKNSYAETWAELMNYEFIPLNSYKITYNANGGENAPPIQTKFENINTKLYYSVPTREGYKCLGWATSSVATSPTHSIGETISLNQNLNLYAIWGLKELYPETLASGTCGEKLKWTFDDNGLLTISGTGTMSEYSSAKAFPWYEYKDSIQKVLVKSGVTSIYDNAFEGYEYLTSINIGTSDSSIVSTMNMGNQVFYGCSNLIEAHIGKSVKILGECVFEECTALEVLNIDSGVETIGESAFYNCITLKEVVIPDSIITLNNYAFENCSSLNNVIIENGIQTLGNYVFQKCINLKSIIIPASVKKIGSAPFRECTSLSSIEVNSNNQNFSTKNNVLFNYSQTKLIQYSLGKTNNSYTIPGTVSEIGESAFKSCSSLQSLTIPSSVKIIGHESFEGCKNLTEVILEEGLATIGENAFEECLKLSSIAIPNSVTNLGKDTFTCCKNLQSVVIGSGISTLNEYTFDSCSSLQSIIIPPSVTTIVSTTFDDVNPNMIIKGKSGSYAQTFANANGYTFNALTTYTITYNANGGSNAPTAQPKFQGINTDLYIQEPTRANHKFLGWATTSTSKTIAYKPGATYSANANITLYAVWENLYPTNVELSTYNVTLFVGDSEKVYATITPTTAQNKTLTWKSANTSIATVTDGTIKAISPGTTQITAITGDSKITKAVNVTVVKKANNIDFSLAETKQSPTSSNIKITIDGDKTLIKNIKWAYGSQNENYFASSGTAVDLSKLDTWVDKNGIYTFCLTDVDDNKIVKIITVSKIVFDQAYFDSTTLKTENTVHIPINFEQINDNIIVYMALYDNGKLIKLQKEMCIPSENIGKNSYTSKPFKLSYPKPGYELKAFAWDENMMPFINGITLKADDNLEAQIFEGTIYDSEKTLTFTVSETREYLIKSYTDSEQTKIALEAYLFGENGEYESDTGKTNFEIKTTLTAGVSYELIIINGNSNANGNYIVVIK